MVYFGYSIVSYWSVLFINNYKKMYISTCLVFMISYVEGIGTLFNAVWYLVSPHTAWCGLRCTWLCVRDNLCDQLWYGDPGSRPTMGGLNESLTSGWDSGNQTLTIAGVWVTYWCNNDNCFEEWEEWIRRAELDDSRRERRRKVPTG